MFRNRKNRKKIGFKNRKKIGPKNANRKNIGKNRKTNIITGSVSYFSNFFLCFPYFFLFFLIFPIFVEVFYVF